MKTATRLGLLAAINVTVVGAVVCFWLSVASGRAILGVGLSLVGVCAVVYALLTWRAHTARTPNYPPPQVTRASVESLATQYLASGVMSLDDAAFYVQMTLDPYRYISRVSDAVAPTSRAYWLTRKINLSIPVRLGDSSVAIPIDLVSKRGLLHECSITDSAGGPIEPLTQAATIAHSLAAVDVLMGSLERSEVDWYQKSLRASIKEFLCDPEASIEAARLCEEITAELDNRVVDEATRRRYNTIALFLGVLVGSYPLVVYLDTELGEGRYELSGSRGFRVTVKRLFPVEGVVPG